MARFPFQRNLARRLGMPTEPAGGHGPGLALRPPSRTAHVGAKTAGGGAGVPHGAARAEVAAGPLVDFAVFSGDSFEHVMLAWGGDCFAPMLVVLFFGARRGHGLCIIKLQLLNYQLHVPGVSLVLNPLVGPSQYSVEHSDLPLLTRVWS